MMYVYDPVSHSLRPRTNSEFTAHPIISKRFLKLVRLDSVKLVPFFVRSFIPPQYSSLPPFPFVHPPNPFQVDASPFLAALNLSSSVSGNATPKLTNRHFRDLSLNASSHPTTLTAGSWNRFWHMSITHGTRNVWYRILHQRLPTAQFMHRIGIKPSPLCPICSVITDDVDHFLMRCPQKQAVWSQVLAEYFNIQTLDILRLRNAIFSLSFPTLNESYKPVTAGQVIGIALFAIWRGHWNFIYEDVPFYPDNILSNIARSVRTAHSEILLQKGCSALALPHFQI